MNSCDIVSAFNELCKSDNCTDTTVLKRILSCADAVPDILTIKKGSILYLSRDMRWKGSNDIVNIALSMDYFYYTEDPRPSRIPEGTVNVQKYKRVSEHYFYVNRYYNKVVLDRDIRVIDGRSYVPTEYSIIKNSLLNVDGVVICRGDNTNLISLCIDNILDICTLIKRIRPTNKRIYEDVKSAEYDGNDSELLKNMIADTESAY